jgi:hypothetical protein
MGASSAHFAKPVKCGVVRIALPARPGSARAADAESFP